MAVEATFELIAGSLLDLTLTAGRKVTRGIIHGLQTDTDPDPEVIWRAYNACVSAGFDFNSPLSGHAAMVVRRIVVEGYTTDGCRVAIYHETPTFNFGPPTVQLTKKRSFMTTRSANTWVNGIGERRPIEVLGWTDPTDASIVVPQDYASISDLHPAKAVEVSGLSYGEPVNAGESLFGYCNNTTWQGLPVGYWILSEFETDFSLYEGYYTFHITAISRVTMDWGEIAVLRNEKTGKYIKIAPSDVETLATSAYVNGLIQVPGATKVGNHPVTTFNGLFGLS